MRSTFFLSCAILLTSALSFIAPAEAQAANRRTLYAADGEGNGKATNPPAAAETVVMTGKITNATGPLPGAVVIIKSIKQMAVTNADGEFEITVPANAGDLQATVTYAGYADEKMTLNPNGQESTLSLTNARVVVVSRKQQLKKYLKTANKQVKKELRQIR